MQIVIDICEGTYEYLKKCKDIGDVFSFMQDEILRDIKDGVVLPKHHGRLIDADKLKEEIIVHEEISEAEYYLRYEFEPIENSFTVLKAGKEE